MLPFFFFYWASKGFIDINIRNEENPILIRGINSLPASYPSYQIYIYDNMIVSPKSHLNNDDDNDDDNNDDRYYYSHDNYHHDDGYGGGEGYGY